jgi:hypothetical protein
LRYLVVLLRTISLHLMRQRWVVGLLTGAWVVLVQAPVFAATSYALDGFPGLIHTPSARLPEAGTVALNISRYQPYSGLTLTVQPFDWLSASLRYISIDDREYGPGIDQSYKDRGFDFALRLWSEGTLRPQVVLGMYDVGGTGLFGSEYLVASKRLGPLDVNAGLAWGRLGSAADIDNPLAEIDPAFAQRADFDDGLGGQLTTDEWFSGESVGAFAGLSWTSPEQRWRVMLEYESKNYDNNGLDPRRPDQEPADGEIRASSRWNVGLSRQLWPGARFGLYYVRGDTLAGQFSLASLWGREQFIDRRQQLPAFWDLIPEALRPKPEASESAAVRSIEDALWQMGIYPSAVDLGAAKFTIWASANYSPQPLDNALAAARVALSRLPARIQAVEYVHTQAGLPLQAVVISRDMLKVDAHWHAQSQSWAQPERDIAAAQLRLSPELGVPAPAAELSAPAPDALALQLDPVVGRPRYPLGSEPLAALPRQQSAALAPAQASRPGLLAHPIWTWGINPALRSNIGGPGGFFLTNLQVKPFLTLQITEQSSLTTTLAWDIGGNLDEVEPRESSRLPNVRSDLEFYQRFGPEVFLEEMEWNTMAYLGHALYGRVSLGIFEEMYAGIGTELLWAPVNSPLAVGLNINRVRQRDYDQLFGFLDYETSTAHLELYWRTPWAGVLVEMSTGRYLAGDRGYTMRMSRQFRNGFSVGAFFTRTNVSAEDFGEGSFDKGIFMQIPFAALDRRSTRPGAMGFNFRFLTRDGGQKVDDGRRLYPLVKAGDPRYVP